MSFKAEQVPLEVDVWNVIEGELRTGITDALHLHFFYSVEERAGRVRITHPKNSEIAQTVLELTSQEAEDLLFKIAEDFNFQVHNLVSIQFHLRPNEIPIFTADIQPYVKDVKELDRKKSRLNILTIN